VILALGQDEAKISQLLQLQNRPIDEKFATVVVAY